MANRNLGIGDASILVFDSVRIFAPASRCDSDVRERAVYWVERLHERRKLAVVREDGQRRMPQRRP